MFATNTIFGGLTFIQSVSTTLLMIDRILALILPLHYRNFYSLLIFIEIGLSLLSGLAYSGVQVWIEWPVERETSGFFREIVKNFKVKGLFQNISIFLWFKFNALIFAHFNNQFLILGYWCAKIKV